jgi:hypothetical protein
MLVAAALLVFFVSIDRYSISTGIVNLRLELIAGGLIALWLFVRSRGAVLQRLGIIEYALLAWLAANVVSSLAFSPSPPDSLKNAGIIAGVLTIFLVGLMLFTSARVITWAVLAWVGVGAVVALLGLASALLYTAFGWTGGINLERIYVNGVFVLTPRVQSTIWEPNIFGSYCITVGILAFALILSPQFSAPRSRLLLSLAGGCAFCGVMLSMTRTAWFAGPLLLVVLVLISLRLKLASMGTIARAILLPAGVGIAIGLVVGNFLMPTLRWERDNPWDLTYSQVEQAVPYLLKGITPPPEIANPSSSAQSAPQATATALAAQQAAPQATNGNPVPATPDPRVQSGSTLIDKVQQLASPDSSSSVQSRLSIFGNTVDGWLKQPIFGWGTGAYPQVYSPGYTDAYWIANLELHMLFDTGVVGLALFAIAVVVAAWRGVRALRGPTMGWSTLHSILLGLLVAGAGLLFAYQVTDATWIGFTWVFFALLVMSSRIVAAPKPAHADAEAS